MGFSDMFGGSGQKNVTFIERSSDVILTTKGKGQLGKLEPVGIEYRILSSIKEAEPNGCTTDEIARKESIPEYKVRDLVKQLIRDGYAMVKKD